MTTLKVAGSLGTGLLSGRFSLLYCRVCSSAVSNTPKHARSYKSVSEKSYSSRQEASEPTLNSAVYKSKYLICSVPVPYGALPYNSPLKYGSHHEQFTSHNYFPYSVILDQKILSNSHYQQFRTFQTSVSLRKEESKVEKTVKALKDSATEKQTAPVEAEETAVVPAKKSLLQKIVGVCKHYYHGFRLLAIDVKISSKLLWQLLNGKTLTRREHNQLVRTTADMFRLFPLLVFILVPFAEFLLPFQAEKEKFKKTLKAKIEMAKFLQKTIKESAVEAKGKQEGQTVESFAQFLDKIRKEGVKPKTKDIMKFAKLFEDEITLDNLTRSQLRACCILLNITPIGSDALLRFILQMKLRGLRADDKMIQKEGVESLSISELQAANRARGMRALGVSEERLRAQLQQWLQLHLEEKIPTSLLLLSRALYLPETLSTEEKLGATITQLAESAADEAKVKMAEMTGETVDNKTKLEIIKHEEAIIAAEKEALAKEARLLEQQGIRDQAEAKAAETAMEAQLNLDDTARSLETSPSEILIDHAEALQASPSEKLKQEEANKISAQDLDEMESVLEEIAKERRLNIEQDALKGLKEEVSEYKEDLEDLKDVAVVLGEQQKQFEESKAARRLAKKVDRMISRLDTVMTGLQEEKSSIQEKMSKEEQTVEAVGDVTQQVQEKIDQFKSNIISINEMIDALKRLKKVPSDSKLHLIFQVLDQDKDGIIDINDALRVLELLSQEHLKLSANQLDEVLHLLKHEAILEEEEQRKEREERERRETKEKQKEKEQTQV
ncbi:unnamed protein product [Candidula unifasciata]|uniref:Mitochondrial proton/calcium exchanger protein n=1 Tax=Candidula unifasciata TaxID=100452 RepID=A0A8S3YUP7_9EUPU|nr:unnamed protein product [Candidula unifasciata]